MAVETNEKLTCIEVAMTSAHERENIEKDFHLAKAHYVIVACKDAKVLKEVQAIVSQVPEHIRNKTTACLLSELLNTKPEEFIDDILEM